jgi:aminoglycoside phosphotransferase (APT) family kinase protein
MFNKLAGDAYLKGRRYPQVMLEREQIEDLVSLTLRGRVLEDYELISSGFINTNYKLRLKDGSSLLLKIYAAGDSRLRRETGALKLVKGKLPAPQVVGQDETGAVIGAPFCLMSWLPDGVPLSEALATASREEVQEIGKLLGGVIKQLRCIEVEDAADGGLMAVVRQYLENGHLERYFRPDEIDKIEKVFEHYAGDIDASWRNELTHGDFKEGNILLRKVKEHWQIHAVFDWEFAGAGSALRDFATLLFFPQKLRISDGYVDAVAQGYIEAGGSLPPDWKTLTTVLILERYVEILAFPQDRGPITAFMAEATKSLLLSLDEGKCRLEG